MRIALITPSLPTRAAALGECVASVATQTRPPDRHLIEIDHGRAGSAVVRNQLAQAADDCDFLAFLDDDDLLYPRHLADLEQTAIRTRADLVYPFCDVHGRDGWTPNRTFDADALRQGNFIPVTVLVRRQPFLTAGGFPEQAANGWEDWALWLKLLDAGARIVCHPVPTWLYRLHPGSKTFVGEAAAC